MNKVNYMLFSKLFYWHIKKNFSDKRNFLFINFKFVK